MNQFNVIKIYTVFTQQKDTVSIQVPIDCKLGDTETSRDIRPGVEISWSKGIEIIQSLFFYYYEIMLEMNIRIFKCSVTFTKRDLWLSHCKPQ